MRDIQESEHTTPAATKEGARAAEPMCGHCGPAQHGDGGGHGARGEEDAPR